MREDLTKAVSVNGRVSMWLNKRALKEANAVLKSDEKVIHAEFVNFSKDTGIFIVTDKRVLGVINNLGDVSVKQIKHSDISRISQAGGQVVGAPGMVVESPLDSILITTINRKRADEVRRTITDLIS